MRNRRKLRRLLAVPLLALATGGVVYMASNTVEPSNAGVTTLNVNCAVPAAPTCTTTSP